MSRKRMLATAAGTVSCALAIGWVMQHTTTPPAGYAQIAPSPINHVPLGPAPVAEPAAHPEPAADLPIRSIKLTSVQSPLPAISDIARSLIQTVSYAPDAVPPLPAEPLTPYLGCAIHATAEPAPLASVRLRVTAPCNGNTRVTVHHAGMMFTEITDDTGRLDVTVPAMSEKAIFVTEFANGKGAVATASVDGLHQLDRIAVQWTGALGFQVHAREFSAAYGTDGHVWTGAPTSENGGAMTRLGDTDAPNPKIVEIYTFPAAAAGKSGTVDLTVEAEVTQANCGRDIAAQSIELRDNTRLRTQDLVLSMPDCSSVGDFLVLNNLVEDLKIAAR